jgi:hypothetical protein
MVGTEAIIAGAASDLSTDESGTRGGRNRSASWRNPEFRDSPEAGTTTSTANRSRLGVTLMRETLPEALSPVALLEVDPDLADRVELDQRRDAVAESRVPSLALRPGVWRGAEGFGGEDVALYVISGFLARSVHAEQRSSVELLGPGHVLRPAVSGGEHAVFARAGWEVLETAWLAVLDLGFWQAIAAHPRVTVGLLDRLVWRSRALSMQLAIVRNPNLSDRLMGLLWHLALSYGRVGPRGMTLPLRLSHWRQGRASRSC